MVYGDRGNVARRVQWRGVLDHHDEETAIREARLLSPLLRYLQGHGRHPEAFHVDEGHAP